MMSSYYVNRLADTVRAIGIHRRMQPRERWSRAQLDALQRERLGAIVDYARSHSSFYRDLYAGVGHGDIRLDTLPTITKNDMMENFDRFVTDPRLRRAELEAHLVTVQEDTLYLDRYRVMCSSGSTGRKGVFVYDRDEWSVVLAGSMRWSDLIGVRPRFPRRTRVAAIGAPDAKHMTCRGAKTMDVGLFNMLRMPATLPIGEMIDRLNAFQPDALHAYPSIAAMLAQTQADGRLRIAPKFISTSSELRTEDMTRRIRDAWGVEPFNCLGLTETGIAGVDCPAHQGLHIFEDLCILEVVDDDNRPIAAGQPGQKVLVTSLFRRLQPIIRMEVSDLLTVSDEPCRCGRTLRRITVMGGRADDVLELPGAGGATVKIHPIHLRSALTKMPAVVQYQIVQQRDGLDCRIVLNQAAAPSEAEQEVASALRKVLAAQGAAVHTVRVQSVPSIERESGAAKFKLIKSDVFAAHSS